MRSIKNFKIIFELKIRKILNLLRLLLLIVNTATIKKTGSIKGAFFL